MKKKKNKNKNKNFQMRFFTFCYQILSILTIGANIGSCPRTTLPLPHGFFHFAPLSRVATSHWARAIVFLSLVVISIIAAEHHRCNEPPREQNISETARIEMHLSKLVKTIL